MRTRSLLAATLLAATTIATSAYAEEPNYTRGTVWEISGIYVKPGQFNNYVDYLATTWKKSNEMAVKDGMAVSYHVYQVNNPRAGEPNMFLAIEYKDYVPIAQREAFQKKMDAAMSTDERKQDKAYGDREVMRSFVSSMQMEELKLK